MLTAMACAWLLWSPASQGQMIESTVTATNGVVVDVNSDSFAERYEYSAPVVNFTNPSGFFLVARIRSAGRLGNLEVGGSIAYYGDWRQYRSAVFRGGAAANYTRDGGRVTSCSGSRYGGCGLMESFTIILSQAEVTQHAENGVLQIQVRPSLGGDPVMLNIPVNYIDAVMEVASHPPAASAAPAAEPSTK